MKDVDSAILDALGLTKEETSIKSHGGSGFSETLKLTANTNGEAKVYFVKIGGSDSAAMFAGEHVSLNAIHSIDPSFCPASHAFGPLSSGGGYFLITDFLHLTTSGSSAKDFAQKLAAVHTASTPIPEGYDKPMFGFPVPTACGSTLQDNGYEGSWADFYGNRRLRGIQKACEAANGADAELKSLIERTVNKVVPALLRDGHLTRPDGTHIRPSLVHGDLWSGNRGRVKEDGPDGEVREVVFDASCSWSHAEFEWGDMRMFGGFGGVKEEYYRALGGEDRPEEEWDDRVNLYALYHHLNHHALFGSGYRSGAISIMKSLLVKYGSPPSN